jgi:hypothetical protein
MVLEKSVSPSVISIFTAIARQFRTDFFVRAENGLKVFRFVQRSENKDSVSQMFGNPTLRLLQPLFVTIKVDSDPLIFALIFALLMQN